MQSFLILTKCVAAVRSGCLEDETDLRTSLDHIHLILGWVEATFFPNEWIPWSSSASSSAGKWFKFLLKLMYLGVVAAGALFTRAFELRQASAGAFTPQERTPLVGDDGAQLPSAPVDPSSMQVDETNENERVPENSLCTICLDAPKDSFFDPCGHRCTCYSCGMRSVSSTQALLFSRLLLILLLWT